MFPYYNILDQCTKCALKKSSVVLCRAFPGLKFSKLLAPAVTCQHINSIQIYQRDCLCAVVAVVFSVINLSSHCFPLHLNNSPLFKPNEPQEEILGMKVCLLIPPNQHKRCHLSKVVGLNRCSCKKQTH